MSFFADRGGLLVPDGHLGRDGAHPASPGRSAQGVGETLVEERGDDPAVEDVPPALEFPGRDEFGPAAAGLRVFELEPKSVGIRPAAGEAEMVVDDVHENGMIVSDARESQRSGTPPACPCSRVRL